MSFLREKHRPNGGPDGGNGGDGGSVYLVSNSGLNTLADFRYIRAYKASTGGSGAGRGCSGRVGGDVRLRVPLGTIVTDVSTETLIGELTREGEELLVAQGGRRGLGNAHFKSSINRTPRRTTSGQPGDERQIRLELKVLADVGLLGLPNAGKSTFLRTVSHARPKIADYPFTTLYPQLGVVDIGNSGGFVIADIPGLIKGAAQGSGLGTRFLRHLNRTRILLHMVDIAAPDGRDIAAAVREIEIELKKSDHELFMRERWLILNKIDTLPVCQVEKIRDTALKKLNWAGPIHTISAVTGHGCLALTQKIMERLTQLYEQDICHRTEGGAVLCEVSG